MKLRYAIVLTLMLAAAAILAAQIRPLLHANVPFAFHVGNDVMPAGEYRISALQPGSRVVLITAVHSGAAVLVQTLLSGERAGQTAKLIFDRYGETYFLREVWIPAFDVRQLHRSKAEQEYARRWREPVRTAVVAGLEQ